ncbi:protein kinase domain-containing protein [Actinomarinicola tropica]|uniref:non-specific serine/threonine protein kinase n=1 Tax=Actinomarinicola tropica TaxID=2789776 RepID=A0A5Q2RL98_9ACTN|nr:PASTA domain-containing protein [Actinomarinicola tropica]QGG94630.1 PASTA domain-containing protein [Actinomarinicola tropica]
MALSRMSDLIGRVLDGRYRLVAPIGTGASGRVFLADDVRLRRRVAVKVLHPSLADDESFLRRFQAEAHAAAALNHPHVMAVYDWGRDDVPYLVTEYLGGGSLRAMLDKGRRLTVSQALLVGLEATRGLDYAHRRGFVHRDVKPANILFGDDQRLRIADFGLARALAEAGWTEPSGAVLGTARYASPEQARGEMVDGKADVYALGLTLIEAVSGQVPFAADTTIATLMARVDKEVELDDSFGPLRPVLERACRPDAAERPDAGALAVAFMAAAEKLPRPETLPLVGAVEGDVVGADPSDATIHGAEPDPTLASPVVNVPAPDPTTAVAVPADALSPRARRKAARAEAKAAKKASKEAATLAAAEADEGRRRRRWPWVLVALLVAAVVGVGTAVAVRNLTEPTLYPVDDYVGALADDVEEIVAEYGWTVERELERRTGVPVGTILEQDPAPDTELEEGAESVLRLVVAEGNELTDVPADLVGAPREQVEAALAEAGLAVGEVTEDWSEDVPAGHVIEVRIPEDQLVEGQLPEETAIGLLVSAGPIPRTLPGVAEGASYDSVAADLEADGLVPERVTEASETVPEGAVIRTEPGEGEQVPRGSTVRVIVSSGLPFVTVPDVAGMDEDEAIERLEDAGLTVGTRVGPPRRSVLVTDPPAGESVRQGTEVTIYTRST